MLGGPDPDEPAAVVADPEAAVVEDPAAVVAGLAVVGAVVAFLLLLQAAASVSETAAMTSAFFLEPTDAPPLAPVNRP